MSTSSQPTDGASTPGAGPGGAPAVPEPGGRPLERRLLGWLLALTVAPALIILVVGGWALAFSLDFTGAVGPWEEVAESGRRVVELVEPAAAGDSAVAEALAAHRAALSSSLTQARRWGFLERRFLEALPWLVLLVAVALVALAYGATRQLARQLAQPIEGLMEVAERLGRGEALPPPAGRSVREVAVLDGALRQAAWELEEARERAVAAERLRVWGEMARRVAHEMKNPLTPLRFAAHRLARLPAPDGGRDAGFGKGFDEAVEVIGQEVGRLEELAAQFSSLGRPPEGPPTRIDLPELLASLLETDAAGMDTALDADPGLPPVLGHYDALFRAFRNLVRNAVEAMESEPEPRLTVAVEAVGGADGAGGAEGDGRHEIRWLDVRIRDHGPGLPPDQADRIFEPDFTTKTRGTGLGLALVRQAVAADGGSVVARNHEDGAELVVRLPVAEIPNAEETP